jgi:1,4-alpha-glucan branching enzyme
MKQVSKPAGFLTFTLHAHLPYVVNHGTWPHGMEWLHEAAAETYLPLLRALKRLEEDGIGLFANINLSPILLEQLSHPNFIKEFPKYVTRKIVAANEDEAFFIQGGEKHYAETARFWRSFFQQTLDDFEALNKNIVAGFRHFAERGLIDIISTGATHGYNPLLGTDESVRAQFRMAVKTHRRHIGKEPRGIWVPECGYRPAGFWNYPVAAAGQASPYPGFDRIGTEQALAESDIEFFFVDTHLVEESERIPSPYELLNGTVPRDANTIAMTQKGSRRLYQPYYVNGPYDKRYATSIFPRDPRTGVQVWSGDGGYPGDPGYLDFHKKRWPGGHRYWQVTGAKVDAQNKLPYWPEEAQARTREHAKHYVTLVREALANDRSDSIPPILCSPFDAELFGHWWFEGIHFLEHVAREVHASSDIQLTSCVSYLDLYPRAGFINMKEGSWGANGDNTVWMNPETSWTYTHIYPAEIYVREVCTGTKWQDGGLGERIVNQLCRELLLLESSDWQFLITTGAARDYAEMRFSNHNSDFLLVKSIWQTFERDGAITEAEQNVFAEIELRDNIFPDINPIFWRTGEKASNRSELSLSSEAK